MSATQVKFRGGNTTEHLSFTGADREMTIDTTKNTVVVHDGDTVGGYPLCRVGLDGLDGRTDLDISNHEKITVTTGGAVTATSFGGDGNALTNLNFVTNIIPTATANILGGIKVGNNLTITNGVLSAASSYSLPIATSSVLGGIKVGSNLSIDVATGVLSGVVQEQEASDFNHDDLSNIPAEDHINWVTDQSPNNKQVHVNNVQANWRTQSALWENANSIDSGSPGVILDTYTIGANNNAFSAGPIAIGAVSVVMQGTSTWVVL